MKPTMIRSAVGIGLAIVILLIGCAGPEHEGPQPVPATATITQNGSPVEGATVTFSPDGAEGKAAWGTTDASGKVALTTYEQGDGAVPGSYKVLVTKTEVIGGATGDEDEEGESEEAAELNQLLPEKYNDLSQTDLEAQVQESGDNNFTFDLEN